MNVLLISHDAPMLDLDGGSDSRERHAAYARTLAEQEPGSKLTVLVRSRHHGRVQREGALTIVPVHSRRWNFALRVLGQEAAVDEASPGVVSTQTPFDDGLAGVRLARRWRAGANIQMRGSFLAHDPWIRERPASHRALDLLGRYVARRARTIRVVSEGERDRLVERFPELQDKIVALHPLVNRSVFAGPPDPAEALVVEQELRRTGIESPSFFMFVGRLSREKNVPLILRAWSSVQSELPSHALVIAGTGSMEYELREMASGLAVERVLWLGQLPLARLPAWYGAADVLLLPSFYEGFGKVVAEAGLCGTGAVATPFVSAQELISPGGSGFVASGFDDHKEMAELLLRVADPMVAAELGKGARQHMERYLLTDDAYMQRLISLWRQTAAAGR